MKKWYEKSRFISAIKIIKENLLNVFFDVDAREWNGRWFNSIRAWKVERVGAQGPVALDAPFPPMNAAPAAPVDFAATDEKDDLPF